MEKVRPAAVAGRFYPGSARELEAQVRGFLEVAAAHVPLSTPAPKAVIAPHAGYIYSGPIAASAYARLAIDRASISRIVLLGPSHRVGFDGLAVPSATRFATPLGNVRIDTDAIAAVAHLPQVGVLDEAHSAEHSLEVHLPFIQIALGDVAVAPFAVGDATADEVAEVIDLLWGGDETRIVVSSDLSHYHEFSVAKELDADTSRAIELLRPDLIASDRACGRTPIAGLLTVARRRGMSVRTVDLRNSGDTAGPRDQVVGYGAYVVA
jgi:AmmeMemoRadiSam system protein B